MYPIPFYYLAHGLIPIARSVTLDPIGTKIVGEHGQFTWTVDPENAELINIYFTSSDPDIVTVEADGSYTVLGAGEFSITIQLESHDGSIVQDSEPGTAVVMTVSTDPLTTMYTGDTQQLNATVSPAGLSDLVYEYTSSDTSVATVDSDGLVTGMSSGTCDITCTVTYKGEITASSVESIQILSIIVPAGDIKQIATSFYSTSSRAEMSSIAVLMNNGDLYTQGANRGGECGTGDTVAFYDSLRKVQTDVQQVMGGERMFMIQKTDGSWLYSGAASNTSSIPLSNDRTTFGTFPTNITSALTMTNVKEITTAQGGATFLMNDGKLYAVGGNTNGQVGNGTTTQVTAPRLLTNSTPRARACSRSIGFIEGVTTNHDFKMSGAKGTWDRCCESVSSFFTVTVPGGHIVDFSGGITGGAGANYTDSMVLRKASSTATEVTAHYKDVSISTGWNNTYGGAPYTTISLVQGRSGRYAIVDGELRVVTNPVNATFDLVAVPEVPQFGPWEASKINDIHVGASDASTGIMGEVSLYNGNIMYKGGTKFFGKSATSGPANFTYVDDLVFSE